MFTSSSTETYDITRSRLRLRGRSTSNAKSKGKGKERAEEGAEDDKQEIAMDILSTYPASSRVSISSLPSVVVAEVFSTPASSSGSGARDWSYAGRLAIRLWLDDELARPRIHGRHLGRRGRVVFDALLTHPVVYSESPVGVSMWLEEPEEEITGWCFRFDEDYTARQFATLAAVLSQDDPVIRRNVRRIERGDYSPERAESSSSWLSRRLSAVSWLSSRS